MQDRGVKMSKKEGKTVFVDKESHRLLTIIKAVEEMSYEELLGTIIKEKYDDRYAEIGQEMKQHKTLNKG